MTYEIYYYLLQSFETGNIIVLLVALKPFATHTTVWLNILFFCTHHYTYMCTY